MHHPINTFHLCGILERGSETVASKDLLKFSQTGRGSKFSSSHFPWQPPPIYIGSCDPPDHMDCSIERLLWEGEGPQNVFQLNARLKVLSVLLFINGFSFSSFLLVKVGKKIPGITDYCTLLTFCSPKFALCYSTDNRALSTGLQLFLARM